MPGLELFGSSESSAPATTVVEVPPAAAPSTEAPAETNGHNVYYNPRLDPKNFLEGPLSTNAATRLRQMLARPGIVVSLIDLENSTLFISSSNSRLPLVSVMASVHAALSRLASLACTRGASVLWYRCLGVGS